MTGEVTVKFTVDATGKVRDAAIERSNHPGFDQAAIDCVLKWKFKPGIKGGRPVSTRMLIPLAFNLDDAHNNESGGAYQIKGGGSAGLPPEYSYDKPPIIKNAVTPVYPYAHFRDAAKGYAKVTMIIDKQGKVIETGIIETSAPEFGLALQAALEIFDYAPAVKNGAPTKTILGMEEWFDQTSRFISEEDRRLVTLEKNNPGKIIPAEKLDAKPNAFSKRSNGNAFKTVAAREGFQTAEAVVEFLIDTKGCVRLPRIVSATNEAWGCSAVQYVSNWRYDPPKLNGKAVVARVREIIKYTQPKPRPAASAKGAEGKPPN